MLHRIIFGGITVQIVKLKLNEARRNSLKKFGRESQCMSLAKQLMPHPFGGCRTIFADHSSRRRQDTEHSQPTCEDPHNYMSHGSIQSQSMKHEQLAGYIYRSS